MAELAAQGGRRRDYVLLAGRYEGIDERLLEREVDEEIAIGDFVVSGGELPALMLIDAIVRQRPGVLNDAESAAQDSFAAGLLDCPHYTRPEEYDGRAGAGRAAVGAPRGDPRVAPASRRWAGRGNGGPISCGIGRCRKEERELLAAYRREREAGTP